MAAFKPSLREELSSYLRDAESWKPEGVVVEAYKKNETGEHESVGLVNVCHHIGCPTNHPLAVKAHQNDFQSQLQAKECKVKKLYLSDEFTSASKK
jgi:Rieske Fe-S protein